MDSAICCLTVVSWWTKPLQLTWWWMTPFFTGLHRKEQSCEWTRAILKDLFSPKSIKILLENFCMLTKRLVFAGLAGLIGSGYLPYNSLRITLELLSNVDHLRHNHFLNFKLSIFGTAIIQTTVSFNHSSTEFRVKVWKDWRKYHGNICRH